MALINWRKIEFIISLCDTTRINIKNILLNNLLSRPYLGKLWIGKPVKKM